MLAMLAPKRALRVAPGGSAPLSPCVARRGIAECQAGTGKQARQPNRKADWRAMPPRSSLSLGMERHRGDWPPVPRPPASAPVVVVARADRGRGGRGEAHDRRRHDARRE